MRHFKVLATALGAALLMAACGGGGDGDQSTKISFTSIVSFGDSLSDVGTYRVAPIAAAGGGKFTVNAADPKTSTIWTEYLAVQMGLNSCAARVGGFGVAPKAVAGCSNYAQGGSRVENAKGVGNATGAGDISGALTHPVATQLANYAIDNGSANFTDKQLVTVLAGANDMFGLTDQLKADATAAGNAAGAAVGAQTFASTLIQSLAAGATNPATAAQAIGLALQTESARAGHTDQTVIGAAVMAAAQQPGNAAVASPTVYGPMVASAQAAATTAGTAAGTAAGNTYAATTGANKAVAGMATAAATLAAYVKTSIVGKGATHVVVINLPDVSLTPMANAAPETKPLILAMTKAFNTTLEQSLKDTAGVVFVDAFTNLQDQVSHPERYGLSNVTAPACDLTKVSSSLVCSAATLVAGDTSHYLFADGVHPTPFVHKLQAQLVAAYLAKAGWL